MNEIKTLVLSSGGTKGVSFIGALEYIEKYSHFNINEVSTFIGTSVGAILCSFLCSGFSTQELKNIILEHDFISTFSDKKLLNFLNNYGIINTDNLRKKITDIFKTKGVDKDISLKDYYNMFKKDLYLISVDIISEKVVYISYKTFPEMKLIDAIISSCSIPMVFPPVKYSEMCLVDGALLEPFCLNKDLFDSKTLILDIKSKEIKNIRNISEYIQKIIHTIVNNNKMNIENDNIYYYKIHTTESSILDTGLTSEKILQLMNEGKESIKSFLKIKHE